MDGSSPGTSVHGIFHARLLDWVAIYLSKGSSWPGIELESPACRQSLLLQADSLSPGPWGKPLSGVRRLICGMYPRNPLWGHFSEESMFFIWNWSISWRTVSQFSHSIVSDSLQSHGLQHARLCCPPPTPKTCPKSCPSSWWCHPTISFSVIHFSSCLQSFPASWSFPFFISFYFIIYIFSIYFY